MSTIAGARDRIYYFLANLLELITIGVLNVGYTQLGRVYKINKYDIWSTDVKLRIDMWWRNSYIYRNSPKFFVINLDLFATL